MVALIIISVLSLVLITLYVRELMAWIKAWNNAPHHLPSSEVAKASIVVPIHNEMHNLDDLLLSLLHQFISVDEVILVCDHCTDGSEMVLQHLVYDRKDCRVIINNGEVGKKESQRLGIEAAKNDIIIFIDADCVMPQWWYGAIASYHYKYRPDMLVAPVFMRGSGSLFEHILELEFLALQMSTAGAALNGTPFMCNGANLSVTKSAYMRNSDLKKFYASGDDMFLLASIKKNNGKVHYIKSKDAVVTTRTPTSLVSYFRQRTRWLRKATGYTDSKVIYIGLLMFLTNMFLLLLYVLMLTDWLYSIPYVVMFVAKLIADYKLLKTAEEFWRTIVDFASVFLLSLVYPLNVLLIAIFTLFRSPKRW